jgi:hypothetical protein
MIGSAMFEDIEAEFRGAALGDERRSAPLDHRIIRFHRNRPAKAVVTS